MVIPNSRLRDTMKLATSIRRLWDCSSQVLFTVQLKQNAWRWLSWVLICSSTSDPASSTNTNGERLRWSTTRQSRSTPTTLRLFTKEPWQGTNSGSFKEQWLISSKPSIWTSPTRRSMKPTRRLLSSTTRVWRNRGRRVKNWVRRYSTHLRRSRRKRRLWNRRRKMGTTATNGGSCP